MIWRKKIKTEDFLKIIENSRIQIIDVNSTQELQGIYKRILNMKLLTKYIDFKCNFKEDICECGNLCRVGCVKKVGWLKFIPEHELEYYAERWDANTGFWRKNLGCMLDVEYRSGACLQYSCVEDIQFKKSVSTYRFMLDNLIDELKREWTKVIRER